MKIVSEYGCKSVSHVIFIFIFILKLETSSVICTDPHREGAASSADEAFEQFMDGFELTNQAINNTAATLHYGDKEKVKKHAVSAVSANFRCVPGNACNKKQMRKRRFMVSSVLLGLYITGYGLRSFPLDIYRWFISLRGERRKSDDMAVVFESLIHCAVVYHSMPFKSEWKEAKNPAPLQKS